MTDAEALSRCGGNVTQAAALLGVARTTLRCRLGQPQEAEKPFKRHIVIPDGQVKAGVPLEHWEWIGKYIADMKPDVVVNVGDFAVMESLSSFDKAKLQFEGRRYKHDISAVQKAMALLMAPISAEPDYNPRLVLTLGNHEHRINRMVENHPELDGILSVDDLGYEAHGWQVIPFLTPITIDGISYCHYFPSGEMGRPVSSAQALLTKHHRSAVMGHVQRTDIKFGYDLDGKRIICLFAGACYQHDEDYLNPIINRSTWRGLWVLNEVRNGDFSVMEVTLDYLRRTYGDST